MLQLCKKLKNSDVKMTTVQDLQEDQDLILVVDSQEINHIRELEGIKEDYGCLFVKVGEGEYTEIYGLKESVPYLWLTVEKLKG